MNVVFTSDRLYFREFEPADAQLIYELNSDPEVVKYLHEPLTSLQKAEEVIRDVILPQYQKHKHGRWAVHRKRDNSFIGWCGLKFLDDRSVVDLGYRFMKKYWGFGYASEAAIRTVQYGFEALDLPLIFGAAHVENIASQKVLEKIGMQYLGNEVFDGAEARTYELTYANYLESAACPR